MGKDRNDRKIKALIFDMDGLLFDSEKVVQKSWYLAGEKIGYPDVGNHIYHTLGFNVVKRSEYFRETFGEDFPVEAFNQATRKIFYQIKEKDGVPKKPGVTELLEYAREREYKLAVATSSRKEYAEELLKSEGIYDYFDGFVFGDMVTHAKPDPEIYLKACELVSAEPQKAVALEDSPNGIRSAYAAGMYPIMVPDLVQPNEEIQRLYYEKCNSLLEVPKILEKLDQ